ncbi:MAG TPA: DUF5916 domain-containing protein [Gemmatimonadales bacterium]
MLGRAGLVTLVVTGLVGPARAQSAGAPVGPVKEARAARVEQAPVVDGRLDDTAWQTARFFSDFVQKQPVEGAPPTERTEVAIVYDEDALYVGARMFSRDPKTIQAFVTRRDNGGQSQHIWISFDTYRDGRTAYSFGITASGVRLDWYHPRDSETDIDDSFDPVWDGKARVDSAGWTAELRIPFSQLRFTDQPVQVWGMNVDRWIPERNEDVFWIPVPTSEQGWSSRMGRLVGIEGIRPSRRVELLPYTATATTIRENPDRANPFDGAASGTVRVGADLKMGLGPNLTLEGTVNPDFGQVEADPAVVNLSAFEVFFDERRPFFTEGSRLLSANEQFFYSRRIGQAPTGPAPGDYVDRPPTSTILGAAKLTGRTAGGLSVGALAAVTGREHARTYDEATGAFGSTEVATPTGYAVARLQQEFGPSASTAGLILTGTRRALEPGSVLAQRLHRSAVTGLSDMELRFANGTYVLSGALGFSYVEGDSYAILRTQRSSARYFQRPDADHVELDPWRTSLTGYAAQVGLSKRNGRHWLWDADAFIESPGLELNDAGRIATADGGGAFASVTYRETRPGSVFQNYSIRLGSENAFNTAFERQFGALRTDVNVTYRNFWRTTLTGWVDVRAQDQFATRGGPSMGTPLAPVVIASLDNGFAAKTRWRGRIYYGWNELDGLTYRLSGGISIRPGPRWNLSVDPNYLRYINPRQYVTELAGGPASTFGRRYVFAFVDQSTWLASIRLNYALKPDLTLEFYGEPFAASGRFYDHGELAAARSRDLRTYGTDGTIIAQQTDGSLAVTDGADGFTLPALDFNVRSFRSNLVLRWEWRPGSTLYLVWQQDRSSATAVGDLVRPLSLFDAVGKAGDNFLALKVSYWVSPN